METAISTAISAHVAMGRTLLYFYLLGEVRFVEHVDTRLQSRLQTTPV